MSRFLKKAVLQSLMKVDLINHHCDRFATYLEKHYPLGELYRYECIQNFQTHWNLATEDLSGMYDRSLSSKVSNRLWGGSRHSAKSIMLEFIKLNPDYVKLAFRDLFSTDRDLVMRIDRFKLHCDELLSQLRSIDARFNAHHHDTGVICMYLAFRLPDEYCLFEYDIFIKSLEKLGAQQIPQAYEIDRYMKVSRIIQSFLVKREGVLKQYTHLLRDSTYYQRPCLMMTADLYRFLGSN